MTFLLLVLLLVPTTCVASTCRISIELKDEFGDETSVSRIGGSLWIRCNSNGSVSNTYLRYVNASTDIRGEQSGKWVIKIDPKDVNWEKAFWEHKKMFQKTKILCECVTDGKTDRSNGIDVPSPILCASGSQHECKENYVCLVNADTGEPYCEEVGGIGCGRPAFVQRETFLCPKKSGPPPIDECSFINKIGNPEYPWPEVEVPSENRKLCQGLKNAFVQCSNIPISC